ncbi:hypothetical protein [Niallia sp. Man26]|uniref:hypothetical protein n=1 Tax=Niallia sp. Man26 TaxID=2912824 RepID=UPI001EDA609D|nr:hypothetical protein [Niallia sp. Man26]UPO88350.1 hypothetical protein L8T27_004055 [Niallia sp. Man26]
MKKLQLSLLLMVFLVMAGCSQSETTNTEVNKLKETNKTLIEDYNKLVDKKEKLEMELDTYKEVDENSKHLTTIIDDFIHAAQKGDTATMQANISKEFTFEKQEEWLTAVNGEKNFPFYSDFYKTKLKSWYLQGIDYDKEKDFVRVFARVGYSDGEDSWYFEIIKEDGYFKISDLQYET